MMLGAAPVAATPIAAPPWNYVAAVGGSWLAAWARHISAVIGAGMH